MKIKVIRIFFGAYLAICITYGALRTVIMPSVTDDNVNSPESKEETAETLMLETEETGSTTTGLTEKSTAASEEESDDDNSFERRRRNRWDSEDDEDIEIATHETETTTTVPTLEDYLRKLRCGGCGNNCSLLNPSCMRGARKESQAETYYYELYGQSST